MKGDLPENSFHMIPPVFLLQILDQSKDLPRVWEALPPEL